ncbi:MAG: AAA family ATPase [Eubacteriales bacterium]
MSQLKFAPNVEEIKKKQLQLANLYKHPAQTEIHLLFALLGNKEKPLLAELKNKYKMSIHVSQEFYDDLHAILKKEPSVGVPLATAPVMSPELEAIYEKARTLADNYGEMEAVQEIHLFLALLECDNADLQVVFQKYKLSKKTVEKSLHKSDYRATFQKRVERSREAWPSLPIIGREEVVEDLSRLISKKNYSNVLLYGDSGVGKGEVVHRIAQLLENLELPLELQYKTLHIVTPKELYLYRDNPDYHEGVLYVPYLGDFLVKTQVGTEFVDIFEDVLLPKLLSDTKVIVQCPTSLYQMLSNSKDPRYQLFMTKMQIYHLEEPSEEEVLAMLRHPDFLKPFEERFHTTIAPEAAEACYTLSQQFQGTIPLAQPEKSFFLLEEFCSHMWFHVKNKCFQPNIPQEKIGTYLPGERLFSKAPEGNIRPEEKEASWSLCCFMEVAMADSPENKVTKELLEQWVRLKSGSDTLYQNDAEERKRVLTLPSRLRKRIIGQEEAITSVSQAVFRAKSGLKDPNRPVASFLFLGSTGVGKTELGKTLAKEMYGEDSQLLTFDMNEYGEKQYVARLIGSPPGYIDSQNGGQLTNAVAKNPYSVILFDEVDKAHPDIFHIFLQILDEGRLTDAQGNVVDFKNTIIILTSNLGAKHVLYGTEHGKLKESTKKSVLREVQKFFKPEFINRLDEMVYFLPLLPETVSEIIKIIIRSITKRLEPQGIQVEIDPDVIPYIVEEAYDPEYGARALKRYIQKNMETLLAGYILEHPEAKNLYFYEQKGQYHLGEFTVTKNGEVVYPKKKIVRRTKSELAVLKLNPQEVELMSQLEARLAARVIGQKEAISSVSQAVRRGKTGVSDPNKPIASFLFLGTTGVGKTELAKALAETLFQAHEKDKLVRFDMSEYGEKHNVARLIGSPTGYTDAQEGGQLTNAVSKMQHCVVLFDEIEKAHPDVLNILLQILDDGRLTDGRGYTVDFSQTIIILTSNLAATEIRAAYDISTWEKSIIKEEKPDFSLVEPVLKQHLREELLNRFTSLIYFRPFSDSQLTELIELLIAQTNKRLGHLELSVSLTKEAKENIKENGFSQQYGARSLKNYFDQKVQTSLSDLILSNTLQKGDKVQIHVKDQEFVAQEI